MQGKYWKVFAVMAVMSVAPAWAVNKCTGQDGKISYQETPCAGQGEKIDARPSSAGLGDPGFAHSVNSLRQSSSDYQDAIKSASEARIKHIKAVNADCDARDVKKLEIGMSSEDALCVRGWRFPKKFNDTKTERSFKQQAVYGGYGKLDDSPKYLYFENGKLIGIQE